MIVLYSLSEIRTRKDYLLESKNVINKKIDGKNETTKIS